MYYYNARYYSPDLGRFISRDPIDIADDVNLYAYVGNNPVNFSDPSGLSIKKLTNDTLDIAGDVIDVVDSIDYDRIEYNLGKTLSDNSLAIGVGTTGVCYGVGAASSVPSVGGSLVLASNGCPVIGLAAGVGVNAAGNYMMNSSNSNGGNGNTNGGNNNSKINDILKNIENNDIDGKTIIPSDKIKDPLYSGGNWVKKAFYDKELGKDFHWMENVLTGERSQIKVK